MVAIKGKAPSLLNTPYAYTFLGNHRVICPHNEFRMQRKRYISWGGLGGLVTGLLVKFEALYEHTDIVMYIPILLCTHVRTVHLKYPGIEER